jgi:hypothetical protein
MPFGHPQWLQRAMLEQLMRATPSTPGVLKGFLGYEGQKTAETCTPKTPLPFRVGVWGYSAGKGVFNGLACG